MQTSTAIGAFLVVVAFVSGTVVSDEKPCLREEQEFYGTDPKHTGPSYFALVLPESNDEASLIWALRRPDGSRMVKTFSEYVKSAARYDIDPDNHCTYSPIATTADFPSCVPNSATAQGDAWAFKNVDGATLYYSTDDPTRPLKKVSPDGKTTLTFSSWNQTIHSHDIFDVPKWCRKNVKLTTAI